MATENVNHRDDDLRFFLARQLPDRERAQQDCSHDHQRRQLGVDPRSRDSAGQSDFALGSSFTLGAHGFTWIGVPSVRFCGTGKIIFSPAASPDSTSAWLSNLSPTVMRRV